MVISESVSVICIRIYGHKLRDTRAPARKPRSLRTLFEDGHLVEFMYFVFTRMQGDLPNATRVFCCCTCVSSFELL